MEKLTQNQRDELKSQHRKERDKRICDRIKAVLAYDDGLSYLEISKILLLDDETIRRYVKDYMEQNSLAPKHQGSKSFFSAQQSQEVISHLKEKTYLSVKEIAKWVYIKYGTIWTVSGLTKWLKRAGFCYKKPTGVPGKANKEAQRQFIESYQSLKESLGHDEKIFFLDSSHPEHQTRLAHGWLPKGKRVAVAKTACQKRVHLIGAIELENHEVSVNTAEKVNSLSIKSFLAQLLEKHPKHKCLHLIWDNAGYHRSEEIKAFIEKEKRLQVHYLPPYSPNLNPIERLWKVMHEKVTYNRYYEKFHDFKESIQRFFEKIQVYHKVLSTRITDNFQLIDSS